MSRQASPKQLISLERELSLFQETVSRIKKKVDPERMVFVTSRELEGDIRDHLRRLLGERSAECTVLGEPVGRNTAPAIMLGARIVQARDPDAILLVAPSDHIIQDVDSFIQAIENSLRAAASGMIVTYRGLRQATVTSRPVRKRGRCSGLRVSRKNLIRPGRKNCSGIKIIHGTAGSSCSQ
jgi:mannose-1-phosphate guanylyltransferase